MKVLVTGGAGFIGSHVVDALVEEGHDVVVLDSLDGTAHAGPPSYLNEAVSYVWRDVRDPNAWLACLDGVDAVSHQAAKVGVGRDFADVTAYVSANDLGTAAGLWAFNHHGFSGRVVLASSMVVYGEGRYRCGRHGLITVDHRSPERLSTGSFDPVCPKCQRALSPEAVTEDAPSDPRTIYAATKLQQEHLCSAFGQATGAGVMALRYHNVYGPRMPRDTPYAGVASIFRSALEAGLAPAVFEDGCQLRDFVHVADVARANILALTAAPSTRGAFNIASGQTHTVGEMADELSGAFADRSLRPKVTGEWRPGDARHVFASTDRAREVLGFQAEVSFAEGMRALARTPLRSPVSGGPRA